MVDNKDTHIHESETCLGLNLIKEKVEGLSEKVEAVTEDVNNIKKENHGMELMIAVFTEKMDGFTSATNQVVSELQTAVQNLSTQIQDIVNKPAKRFDKLIDVGLGALLMYLLTEFILK